MILEGKKLLNNQLCLLLLALPSYCCWSVSRLSERVEGEIRSKKEVFDVKPLNSSHPFSKDLKSANKKISRGMSWSKHDSEQLECQSWISCCGAESFWAAYWHQWKCPHSCRLLFYPQDLVDCNCWQWKPLFEVLRHHFREAPLKQPHNWRIPIYNKELKREVIDNICRLSKEIVMIPHPPTLIPQIMLNLISLTQSPINLFLNELALEVLI